MDAPAWLEKLLVALLAVAIVIWYVPRLKSTFTQRQSVSKDQWVSVLIPLLVVVAFVLLLIKLT